MDETLRAHVDASLGLIEDLMRRGREIKVTLAVDVIREWQRDCSAAINQLSGLSKAHWLARAYSSAFLVRATGGAVVVEASAAEIVDRILDVLAQARTSLTGIESLAVAPAAGTSPRRFEFVHNAELRPVLEQAFADSRDALERGEFGLALILSCGVIEAVLTDALDYARPQAHDAPDARMADWSFEMRIAAAEQAGLIRGGCARLPPVARKYRDLSDAAGDLRADAPVSEREARLAGQVLRVVMRDLDPGR
jgi:hypothetical protein